MADEPSVSPSLRWVIEKKMVVSVHKGHMKASPPPQTILHQSFKITAMCLILASWFFRCFLKFFSQLLYSFIQLICIVATRKWLYSRYHSQCFVSVTMARISFLSLRTCNLMRKRRNSKVKHSPLERDDHKHIFKTERSHQLRWWKKLNHRIGTSKQRAGFCDVWIEEGIRPKGLAWAKVWNEQSAKHVQVAARWWVHWRHTLCVGN